MDNEEEDEQNDNIIEDCTNNAEDNVNNTLEDSVRPTNTQETSYAGDDENDTNNEDDTEQSPQNKDKSPTPSFNTPNFNLFSQESPFEKVKEDVNEKNNDKSTPEKTQKVYTRTRSTDRGKQQQKQRKRRKIHPEVVTRRSTRGQIPTSKNSSPFTAEKKKYPKVYPFLPVNAASLDKLSEWTKLGKTMVIEDTHVNGKWFSEMQSPGKAFSIQHVDVALLMLKKRREMFPDQFRQDCVNIRPSFFHDIDEKYFDFLHDDEFQFHTDAIEKGVLGPQILFIYLPFLAKAKCWVLLTINLVQQKIIVTDFTCTHLCEKSLIRKLSAFLKMMPFFIQSNRGEKMNTTEFEISFNTKMSTVTKIQDTGIYMIKVMECYALGDLCWNKLQEDNIEDLRNKLAADIFEEFINI